VRDPFVEGGYWDEIERDGPRRRAASTSVPLLPNRIAQQDYTKSPSGPELRPSVATPLFAHPIRRPSSTLALDEAIPL